MYGCIRGIGRACIGDCRVSSDSRAPAHCTSARHTWTLCSVQGAVFARVARADVRLRPRPANFLRANRHVRRVHVTSVLHAIRHLRKCAAHSSRRPRRLPLLFSLFRIFLSFSNLETDGLIFLSLLFCSFPFAPLDLFISGATRR